MTRTDARCIVLCNCHMREKEREREREREGERENINRTTPYLLQFTHAGFALPTFLHKCKRIIKEESRKIKMNK